MLSWAIIKKELRENIWIFVIILAIVVANTYLNSAMYETLKKMIATQGMPTNMPSFAKDYANIFKDFNYYTWSGWFDKTYLQMLTICAVLLGMGTIAKEVSNDTIGFLLSKPFSRFQVFASKFTAGAVILLALGTISSIFNHIFATLFNKEYSISLAKTLLGVLNSMPGLLLIFSVAAIFSTLLNDRIKAGLLSAVVALGLAVPSFFPDYADYNLYKYFVGTEIFKGEGFPWTSFILLILAVAVLFTVGSQLFKRRQF